MSLDTPPVTIVEVDGLWFRFQKMRGRRSTRGVMALAQLLGAGVVTLLSSPQFESEDDRGRLVALGQLIAASAMTGGKATVPDVFEAQAAELLMYTPGHGGQGVSYSDTKLDAGAEGWVPMASLASLDPWAQVDYSTHLTLLWEVIKLNYRPTRAGSGTAAGTDPAAGTRPTGPTGPASGSKSTPTPRQTGALAL